MLYSRAFQAVRSLITSTTIKFCLHNSIRTECVTAREVLQSIPDPQLTALKNGFRVVTENNQKQSATVGVWVDSGPFCEDEENCGASNFLEHLIYKGTQKRSGTVLQDELIRSGIYLRSYVDHDRTAVFAECAAKDVDNVVRIIADVLLNSTLTEEAIELTRSQILDDISNFEDNSREVVFDLLHKAAFQGTPYAKPLFGTTKSVKSMSRKKLLKFYADHYVPSRMVLVGVGGIDHEALVGLSEECFGSLSAGNHLNSWEDKMGVRFTGSEIRYRNDYLPFMFGAIAVEGVEFGHLDNIPLQIAQTMVGQWDRTVAASYNSPNRLVQKVSGISDLHCFQSFVTNYKNCGLFGVYFVAEGKDIVHVFDFVKAVQKEWKYMTTSVTEEEIDRAKNSLKTSLFSLFESDAARADYLGRYALCMNEVPSLLKLDEAIENVDGEVLHDTIMRNVYNRDIATAGAGRTEAFPDYMVTRYGMSWWRL